MLINTKERVFTCNKCKKKVEISGEAIHIQIDIEKHIIEVDGVLLKCNNCHSEEINLNAEQVIYDGVFTDDEKKAIKLFVSRGCFSEKTIEEFIRNRDYGLEYVAGQIKAIKRK